MPKLFTRSLFVLTLLLILIAVALPALASSARPERLAPGWNQLFPPLSPSGRTDHAMAYDTARGVAMVLGGYDNDGNYLNDHWEWDSQTMTWTEKQPAHRPSARAGHAMVYDAARGVTVLFGGDGPDLGDYMNDTWIYDANSNDWTEVFPTDAPSERWLSAMAYDPDRQVVTLFGGEWSINRYGDTFEWAGANWVEQDITNATPRSGGRMAYDPRRDVMVLFGGVPLGSGSLNEVWERTGSGDWQDVTPAQSPPKRARGGLVYYPRARQTFMFGGEDFVYYNDTAVWSGLQWSTKPFSPVPSSRCCFGMVYDSVLKGVLLFGGSTGSTWTGDTWLFK